MLATNPVMQYVDKFSITGLKIRTQTSDEYKPKIAKIPALWEQFFSINNNPITDVVAVYSGYASDANGPYDVTVGTRNRVQQANEHSITIQSGNYLIFQGKGEMPLTVVETWKRAWQYLLKTISMNGAL